MKKVWDTVEVKKYIKENSECELISEYKNMKAVLQIKCKCGNIFERTMSAFVNNVRRNKENVCKACGRKNLIRKRAYPENKFEEYFENYKNSDFLWKDEKTNKLLFICQCGKVIRRTFAEARNHPTLQCEECTKKQKWKTKHYKSLKRIFEYLEENNIEDFDILKGKNLHKTKITIPCSECGENFTGTFNYIVRLDGRKCDKCIMKEMIKKTNLDFNKIIDKANAYNMTLLTKEEDYINMNTKLDLICSAHPESTIRTTWAEFRYYCPCKKCTESQSTLEKVETEVLEKHDVYYLPQQTNPGCKYKSLLIFDFVLYSNKEKTDIFAIIETNGEQHERPVQFGGVSIERAEELFEEQKIKDQIKRDFCKSNNIPLLELRYIDMDKYEELTLNFLEQNKYRRK